MRVWRLASPLPSARHIPHYDCGILFTNGGVENLHSLRLGSVKTPLGTYQVKKGFVFMDNENLTSGETVKNTAEEVVIEQPKVEEKQDATIADILEEQVEEAPQERTDTVPLKKYVDIKHENKELKQQLADLQSRAEKMTTAEITDDLQTLANEHNIDPAFLSRLAGAIKREAEKDLDNKLKPFAEKERRTRIDAAFAKTFTDVMSEMPEYKDVVNPEVIKTLSLNPSNRNKTFRQIIEETYGNALGGRRTIESTSVQPKTAGPLDYDKAKSDHQYFKEVMADPKLKREYNEKMLGESMS